MKSIYFSEKKIKKKTIQGKRGKEKSCQIWKVYFNYSNFKYSFLIKKEIKRFLVLIN